MRRHGNARLTVHGRQLGWFDRVCDRVARFAHVAKEVGVSTAVRSTELGRPLRRRGRSGVAGPVIVDRSTAASPDQSCRRGRGGRQLGAQVPPRVGCWLGG